MIVHKTKALHKVSATCATSQQSLHSRHQVSKLLRPRRMIRKVSKINLWNCEFESKFSLRRNHERVASCWRRKSSCRCQFPGWKTTWGKMGNKIKLLQLLMTNINCRFSLTVLTELHRVTFSELNMLSWWERELESRLLLLSCNRLWTVTIKVIGHEWNLSIIISHNNSFFSQHVTLVQDANTIGTQKFRQPSWTYAKSTSSGSTEISARSNGSLICCRSWKSSRLRWAVRWTDSWTWYGNN